MQCAWSREIADVPRAEGDNVDAIVVCAEPLSAVGLMMHRFIVSILLIIRELQQKLSGTGR
jgi:hypothetical protein